MLGQVPYVPPYVPPKYASPTTTDVQTPTLQQMTTVAPNIPGVDWSAAMGGQSGNSGGTAYVASSTYMVSPGTFEPAENAILANTNTLIDGYTTLRTEVNSTKPWIFQVNAPGYLDAGSSVQFTNDKKEIVSGQVMSTDLGDAEDQALRASADAIDLAGKLVAWLNHAAQTYAKADINSVLPTPTPPVGPPLGPVHDHPGPIPHPRH